MTGIETIRRRVDRLDQAEGINVYFIDCDECDPNRLPDGPEVQAEIAAIEARDPRAHIIKWVMVDGSTERPA